MGLMKLCLGRGREGAGRMDAPPARVLRANGVVQVPILLFLLLCSNNYCLYRQSLDL